MISCRESTQLASDRLERRLSLGERLQLRIHLLVCPYCRRFEKQIRMMTRVVRRLSRLTDGELEELGRREDVDRERFVRSLEDS